jgi:hypothetical protein
MSNSNNKGKTWAARARALNEILLGSAASGDLASVKEALKDGADPGASIKTSSGEKSARDLAANGGHAEIVRVLVAAAEQAALNGGAAGADCRGCGMGEGSARVAEDERMVIWDFLDALKTGDVGEVAAAVSAVLELLDHAVGDVVKIGTAGLLLADMADRKGHPASARVIEAAVVERIRRARRNVEVVS